MDLLEINIFIFQHFSMLKMVFANNWFMFMFLLSWFMFMVVVDSFPASFFRQVSAPVRVAPIVGVAGTRLGSRLYRRNHLRESSGLNV